ncbi:SDR family oxidoreductase [Sciscionella marina]|uniref:SDR family oxidoreductase n=1 Tax=Sciscionella marina TaxID=508770 RepID=UPI0003714026|nr:SDR family oxidoreductase [Sciscionella marina]
MPERQLVTGATGFLGAALVLRLLEDTDARLVTLVRAGTVDPWTRLRTVLTRAAIDYGHPSHWIAPLLGRIELVVGDLLQDPAPEVGAIDRVWHGAASLRYAERDREAIYAANVVGTERALAIAANAGARRFHYISTAYVAGNRSGMIFEQPVGTDAVVNNVYEESKIAAEAAVLAADTFETQILRPSIIVGHSVSLATSSAFGLYGFLDRLARFRRILERRDTDRPRRLSLLADPSVPANLVPVDVVARQAVRLALPRPSATIVHLTNDRPPTVGEVIDSVFDAVNLPRPRYVSDRGELSRVDEHFDRSIEFYRSYITGHKHFRQDTANAAAGPLEFPFNTETLRRLCRVYLDQQFGASVPEGEEAS